MSIEKYQGQPERDPEPVKKPEIIPPPAPEEPIIGPDVIPATYPDQEPFEKPPTELPPLPK